MLFYIILFCAIGFVLRLLFTAKVAISVILIVTIGWAFVQGPWALATFAELLLGYWVGHLLKDELKDIKDKI